MRDFSEEFTKRKSALFKKTSLKNNYLRLKEFTKLEAVSLTKIKKDK
jgi:hypothetical protein